MSNLDQAVERLTRLTNRLAEGEEVPGVGISDRLVASLTNEPPSNSQVPVRKTTISVEPTNLNFAGQVPRVDSKGKMQPAGPTLPKG